MLSFYAGETLGELLRVSSSEQRQLRELVPTSRHMCAPCTDNLATSANGTKRGFRLFACPLSRWVLSHI